MADLPERATVDVSAELVAQLARYAGLPLPAADAAALAPLLGAPLAVIRALRPDGYADLVPSNVYRIPEGP